MSTFVVLRWFLCRGCRIDSASRPVVSLRFQQLIRKEVFLPIPAPALDTSTMPVLCVDLDGTLVKSDTLIDSTLALARQHPTALLKPPKLLPQGKATLKKNKNKAVQ